MRSLTDTELRVLKALHEPQTGPSRRSDALVAAVIDLASSIAKTHAPTFVLRCAIDPLGAPLAIYMTGVTMGIHALLEAEEVAQLEKLVGVDDAPQAT